MIKRYIIHSLFIDDVIIWDGYFLFEQPCDNDAAGRVDSLLCFVFSSIVANLLFNKAMMQQAPHSTYYRQCGEMATDVVDKV